MCVEAKTKAKYLWHLKSFLLPVSKKHVPTPPLGRVWTGFICIPVRSAALCSLSLSYVVCGNFHPGLGRRPEWWASPGNSRLQRDHAVLDMEYYSQQCVHLTNPPQGFHVFLQTAVIQQIQLYCTLQKHLTCKPWRIFLQLSNCLVRK